MPISTNVRMATSIDCYEKIAELEQINGVPIARIEERARPGCDSGSGFLGANESLKDVLQQDWKAVQALETTHIELAAHLRAIWEKVKEDYNRPSRNFNRPLEFSYKADQLPNYTFSTKNEDSSLKRRTFFILSIIATIGAIIGALTISSYCLLALLPIGCIFYKLYKNKPIPVPVVRQLSGEQQKLQGTFTQTKGSQVDLFRKNYNGSEWGEGSWSSDLELKNLSTNQSVTIGEGVIDYIEKYGFYEGGGDKNCYRVDPIKLISILTGSPLSALQSRVKRG